MEYRCRPPEPPLPPIRIERKNPEYARLLLADYAGKAGEFTASTQYIYQAFITHQSHPRLSEDLEHISIAEMRHMERLGKLIVLLGGNPLLRTCPMGGCCYWEGCCISPTREVTEFLEEDIQGEKAAIANYRQRIRQIQDRYIQAVLEQIIQEEEAHIEIFRKYLEYFRGEG